MRLDPNGDSSSFPKRAALPQTSGTPKGNAWFWGGNDSLGRLNLLTPQRIAKVTQENVKSGDSISLDLPLNVPGPAFFGRASLKHCIKSIGPGAFDDEISYNTQSSSQWDGFRHFANPEYGCHYNGMPSDEIAVDNNDDDVSKQDNSNTPPTPSHKLGIDAWAKKGIIGRGVLLDIYTWSRTQSKPYDPFTHHNITASDLLACAAFQNTTFQTGDILLIRTGWLSTYHALTPAQKQDRGTMDLASHFYAGLAADEEMKDFLHDNYFAAAATDNVNFEVWPPESFAGSLHASMLSLWGMPIGELWDLEGLVGMCREKERWAFLLVSKPVCVPGGVGSPPNAVAIF
ncbi:hypothetical protein CFE70_003925 [Pyrenophora teres f. teres 0-1]|uniref:Cyclase domain containing protein n=2 Tax=Pyrenophora teres f. teres TaxID=97479 RepID=E3S8S8_PYRTT|nr:hypothetical protein PTT_19413 [Pyrenophora teres f. teres 0-1]KAE8845605.1 hypothetical protein HRS9139_00172 [Pyrenophora teres f. teres]KAE8847743.1 hypothetical protein PTNB85_01586 [Pyrenophora teres f. teres]KAE8854102.1 hypothetical protein HRS9122_01094 [Pyrenophora teres f. teres]KAE8867670.1 hypothetical protein PTNB29_01581 [Pyrenophora teres f. teres]